jgi:hypothetical protein
MIDWVSNNNLKLERHAHVGLAEKVFQKFWESRC